MLTPKQEKYTAFLYFMYKIRLVTQETYAHLWFGINSSQIIET